MAKKTYDYQFKILLIGDSSVGKTSILKAYTTNDQIFDNSHIPTIGMKNKEYTNYSYS
jgi:GTPase SAR1 family protein